MLVLLLVHMIAYTAKLLDRGRYIKLRSLVLWKRFNTILYILKVLSEGQGYGTILVALWNIHIA